MQLYYDFTGFEKKYSKDRKTTAKKASQSKVLGDLMKILPKYLLTFEHCAGDVVGYQKWICLVLCL